MIVPVAQAAAEEAHKHVGQALLGTTGGSFVFGMTIAHVNEYLQAGAFAVSMIAGACAAVYYAVHVIAKLREMRRK
jgi:hypothetical protein